MNKKYLVLGLIVLVIVLLAVGYILKERKVVVTQVVSESILSSTSTPVLATSTVVGVQTAPKTSLLQASPYRDSVAKFSISLPKDWVVQDKTYSTTTASIRFGGNSSTIVVDKHSRSAEVERVLKQLGPGGLIDTIVNGIVSGFNQYALVLTESISINGVPFRKVVSTYVGMNSKKQATHHLYVTLTDDAYYFIGIDAYSDIWDKNKDAILQSVNTFTLL